MTDRHHDDTRPSRQRPQMPASCRSSRRRAGPAKHRLVRQRDLLRRLLVGYTTDTAVFSELVRCAKRNRHLLADPCSAAPTIADLQAKHGDAIQPLIDSIDAFIEQFGLARLVPSVLHTPELRDLVVSWVVALRDWTMDDPRPQLPVRLPELPELPALSTTDQRVAVPFNDQWDPERETRDAALARMTSHARTLIGRQLNAVAERYEDHEYVFGQHRPELDRHIRWLVLRVAHGKSPVAIEVLERGSGHAVTAGAIQNATNRLAREIGIRLPNARPNIAEAARQRDVRD